MPIYVKTSTFVNIMLQVTWTLKAKEVALPNSLPIAKGPARKRESGTAKGICVGVSTPIEVMFHGKKHHTAQLGLYKPMYSSISSLNIH